MKTITASQRALLNQLPVGSRVYALENTAICAAHEPGIVYQIYSEYGQDVGRAIIFKNGGLDGFSASELEHYILPEGSVDPTLQSYNFINAHQVHRDFSKGLFKFDFPVSFEELEALILEKNTPFAKKTASPPRV